jgi:hypothetical protein
VNNAVGVLNHKHFLLFVSYTFAVCIYGLALCFACLSHCSAIQGGNDAPSLAGDKDHTHTDRRQPHLRGHHRRQHGRLLLSGLAVAEGAPNAGETAGDIIDDMCDDLGLLIVLVIAAEILFGLFTMCMVCDQWPMLVRLGICRPPAACFVVMCTHDGCVAPSDDG